MNYHTQEMSLMRLSPTETMEVPTQQANENLLDKYRYYWRVLRDRWLIVLIAVGVVLFGSVLYDFARKTEPIYRASATISILPAQSRNIGEIHLEQNVSTRSLQILQSIFESRAFATKIREQIPGKVSPQLCQAFFGSEQISIGSLLVALQFNQRRGSRDIVDISCTGKHPEACAQIANLAVEVLIQENSSLSEAGQSSLAKWLREEIPRLENKILDIRELLHGFQEKNIEVVLTARDNEDWKSDMVSRLRGELQEVDLQLLTLEIQYNKCQQARQLGTLQAMLDLDFFEGDPLISALQQEKIQQESNLSALKLRYRDKHPEIVERKHSLRELERKIREQAEQIVRRRELKYLNMRERRTELVKRLREQQNKILALQKKYLEYENYRREEEILKKTHASLLDKMKELDLTSSLNTSLSNIHRIDDAVTPSNPYTPGKSRYYMMCAMLALMTGIGLVFFLDHLDQTIKSADEVQYILPFPFQGSIPHILSREFTGKISQAVQEKDKSTTAEAFHAIATSLLLMTHESKQNSFIISSSLAGEGKTTILCNLGLTIAQAGYRVLLVDGDLRRPQLHNQFEIEQAPGLSELLQEQTELDAVICPIHENLFCIPAGKPPQKLYKGFHAKARALLEGLRKKFDYVLIDAPPLGITSEALILTQGASSLLFVVSVQNTPKKMLYQISRRFQTLNIPVQGVILNNPKGAYYAHDASGIYYDYYDKEDTPDAEEEK